MNKFIDYLKSEYQLFLGFLFVAITNLLVFLVASLSLEYYWLFIEILLLGLVVYLVARFPSYQKERTLDEQVEELKEEIKRNENSYINKRKELEEYFLLWTHQIKTPITVSKLLFRNYEPIHQLVIADSKWLSIMIEQLIANAVKYTNEGSITISYNKQTRQLAIKDTGIGIREEDIPKIFDRGYSGFNGRLNEKSSGLGLYLVRKIALLLNIEIDVDSKLNVGSTFSLKFPANLTNL
nr:ATP-binding protein [uncultured Sharpea sp.]